MRKVLSVRPAGIPVVVWAIAKGRAQIVAIPTQIWRNMVSARPGKKCIYFKEKLEDYTIVGV